MSRSYRKTPIVGIAGGSEKEDKRMANQKFRKKSKQSIIKENIDKLPYKMEEIQDIWSMSKDGKIYLKPSSKYFKSGKWKRK